MQEKPKQKRSKGDGSVFLRGRIWSYSYTRGGRRVCRSSSSTKKSVANALLRRELSNFDKLKYPEDLKMYKARIKELYEKYKAPAAYLFDLIMREFDIPIRFKNIGDSVNKNGKRQGIKPKDRFDTLERDNFTCQYCGSKPPNVKLVIDHKIPKALGGIDEINNYVTACEKCNKGKRDKAIINIDSTLPHVFERDFDNQR